MIRDFNDYDNDQIIKTDICIVGAGVAGLTLAREWEHLQQDILILESGAKKDESATQNLYRSDVVGLPHDGIHNGRFRVLGGSSTRWGAQLMTFEELDFKERKYVNINGWPIKYNDVEKYYDRAQKVLNINSLSYEESLWSELGVDPLPFDKHIINYRFSKWAEFKSRNLARNLNSVLQQSKHIDTLLHANLYEVVINDNQNSVDHLLIKSLSGKSGKIQANVYIFCTGAIETARILLASNSRSKAGVGNKNDLVGRYFQDHVSIRAATLKPHDRANFSKIFDPFFRDETMLSCKLRMSEEYQKKESCLNVMGHVVYGFTEESGLYELRKVLRALQSKKNPIPSPISAWRILRYSSDILRMVFGTYLAKRRLSPRFAKCYLDIECEQLPSYESRVYLSDKLDELGMPVSILDWQLSDLEKKTIKSYIEAFKSELERMGIGEAKWIDTDDDTWMDECRDTYHHAGTTRMSIKEEDGVVDANLKVHGIDNLYIGSTSVFPTSSCANPTLTMMALCIRLSDHLLSNKIIQ